ncbi:hypothetical protein Poli38472_011421 [Pythium oligandrum]|uniref:Methyltransferase type 11 domain-containing protein n=1 Tax=Pythium oligandrum TaxID=41045 RepID=A0A8K1CKS4_PYTOL|nr:hypothetical protein Poli38472_011421 [Pythium oligandrum]|eukprot:TMW64541.1 hypothetical protein Poli38472_011421 [Pythium oligandrum]
MSATERLAVMRQHWSGFAARFTETANRRVTLQCATQMHAHMQLERATSVLEVAAGAGLGSLDVVQHLKRGNPSLKKKFVVTDFSSTMVEMARENLKDAGTDSLEIQVMEANGQDLVQVESGSMDRYLSSLCLQLAPEPDAILREARRVLKDDGIAGFTIWARPEFSSKFTIDAALEKELGLSEGKEHPNFAMGKDLDTLRARFAAAGFNRVMIWPFLCVLELWSGADFAEFHREAFYVDDEELRTRRYEVAKRMADEWLAKGFPIGLETYIILARP